MAMFSLVFKIFLILVITFVIDGKILIIPHGQEDCPCDDRVIITDGMVWSVNDEGQTILTGSLAFTKKVESPISIRTDVEVKKKGTYRFFLHQSFHDACAMIQEEGKPYTFLVKHLPQEALECPFEAQNLTINDAIFNPDMDEFLKFTSENIGSYRAQIAGTAKVDGFIKPVICYYIFFDVVEVDD